MEESIEGRAIVSLVKLIEPEVVEADKEVKVVIADLSSSRKSINKAEDLIFEGKFNGFVIVYCKSLIGNSRRGIRGNRGTRWGRRSRRGRWRKY